MKSPGNPTKMDCAAFWTPSPIETFHPGPSAAERWRAKMAKARLEAAKVVEDVPDCYRWWSVAELMGE
jgi:hypothetical protein